ncbi:MAG: formate dehydrogenase accessory protein [Firmicutes bacterium ADurb.Bin373]|nr:formate dehydrogenase accessory sulfurtransferase FdhD [Bacillota bacterium]OQA09868.1 MAG: formate dehydrogenase accessory protein [Firmicutes bacterium ADurb.Bin373]
MSDENDKTVSLPVSYYKNGSFTEGEDIVVREAPVTLYLNDQEFVTLVCSPGELKELAVGFLCSEGVLMKRENLKSILINEDDGLIWVETAVESTSQGMFLKRFVTSCCGRGRASFYFINDTRGVTQVESGLNVTPRDIFYLSEQLEKLSEVFKATGGAHSAALCTRDGVVFFYEDIGRHNAVDKIFGRCFLDDISYDDKILVFSGRISSEILIKVAKMGIPVIVSRSAPTELAVKLADQLGITVIGFAREGRLSVYTHHKRVTN